MGYRSDVGLALPVKDAQLLFKEYEDKKVYNLMANCAEKRTFSFYGEDWEYYLWDWLKWYEDYPDVKIIEDYMRSENSKYCFIRLGEDLDDNELAHKNDVDENIFYPCRTISICY